MLGADMDHPSSIIEIHAPVSGVITDQQVTASAGVKTLDNSPNLFTISDLSKVWIICDVYENDMSFVRVGEFADVHLAAYPQRGSESAHRQYFSHAGPEHPDREGAPGSGQFRAVALRDVRDRDLPWIAKSNCTPRCRRRQFCICTIATGCMRRLGDNQFRRIEVVGGNMLPGGLQEIISGIQPGQQVVSNALVLQSTVEQ